MMIPVAALNLMAVLFLLLCFSATAQVTGGAAGPPPGCPTSGVGVSVPYPFGMGDGCHWPGFNLTCDRTHGRLLIGGGGGTLEVVEISLANSTVRVMDSAGAVNITYHGTPDGNGTWGRLTGAGPFVVSEARNQFVVTGCNVQATLLGDTGNVVAGCSAFCAINDRWEQGAGTTTSPAAVAKCSGIGCCETPIPIGRPSYGVEFKWLDPNHEKDHDLPNAVRVAKRGWFEGASARLLNNSLADSSTRTLVPVVLEWAVESAPLAPPALATTGCPHDTARSACRSSLSSCRNVTGNYRSGYVCQCQDGYQGNPYVAGGCQDIDESALPGLCYGNV